MLRFRVVSFDCYGTLVDSEAGRAAFFAAEELRRGGSEPLPGWRLRQLWEERQFELILQPYRPYTEIVAASCRRVAEARDWAWNNDDDRFLRATRTFQPFPDTRPVLQRVRQLNLRVAILSNTDAELMSHTLRQLDTAVDEVVTAEDCGAYKPSDAFFEAAEKRFGDSGDGILHVAFGYRYDVLPARARGWTTGWLNRRGDPQPDGPRPDYEWRTLWDLVEFLQDSPA